MKDHQNNMWFGSYAGLHKHEGTAIKVYTKSDKDSNSLSSNEIHPVFEDRLGFIWAGTTGGLDKINPATGKITHYKVRSEKANDDNIGWIYSIFQDKDDSIWMTSGLGMFVIDYTTGKYRQIANNERSGNGLPETDINYKSTYTTAGGIWMATNCRLAFYDYKTHQFIHRFHNPLNKPIFNLGGDNNSNANTDICVDSAHNLYFIAKNSLLMKYNILTEKIDSFPFELPVNSWKCCYSIAADYKGNIWMGFRNGGILYFNAATHQFTPIRYNDNNSIIATDYIYSLCEDYLHRMWVTTNNGIFIINYYDNVVKQHYLSEAKEFTTINYIAGFISQDQKGNIYIPYNTGGLFQYNVFSGNNRYFPVTDTAVKNYAHVLVENDGKILISTKTTFLEVDTSSHKITVKAPQTDVYKALENIHYRTVWMYKRNDQSIYFKKTNGKIYYYNSTPQLEEIPSLGYSKQLCASKDGKHLYYLTENGDLARRNMANLATDTMYIVDKLRKVNFLYANTRDVADDGNGNVWITTQNGLLKYTLKTDSISIYTIANGLLHDFTFTLCADSKNRLWVGSMGGVNLYDPLKNTFINVFTESPDKLSDYFGSSLEAADGHIYFLFGGKLINIDPDGFLKRQLPQRQLRLNMIEVNETAIDTSDKTLLHLDYTQNRLYFRFGLLEFAEPQKVKYFYCLKGVEEKWIALGNRSEITFNSLQPGNYQLTIKAIDVYGNEVKQTLVVPFHIMPPFWQTGWFRALCFSLLALVIYWFFKKKQKEINQQKEQLEIEQAINYFSTAMHGQKNIEEMLWSVTKNCIANLGLIDCVIYLLDENRNILVQKAAYGPKNPKGHEIYNPVERALGQGIVGCVAANGKGEIIKDTSRDDRYVVDDEVRLSELTVPIMYEGKLLGVIDSEHTRKNFYKEKHLSIFTNIASICAVKIVAIQAEESKQQALLQIAEHKRKLATLELKALRAQMNPHFIFNAMNSIQHFSLQNDFSNANKYLSSFSKLLRMVLHQTEHSRITLANEIEMLEPYLSIEALRLGSQFSYTIEVEDDLETEAVWIPSMIIQPFVENALKHGLSSKKGERILHISFALLDDHHLMCIVTDNGIGRKKAAEIAASRQELIPHQSFGMKLVKERLALLEEGNDHLVGIHIIDLTDENGNSTGTKVEVVMPVE